MFFLAYECKLIMIFYYKVIFTNCFLSFRIEDRDNEERVALMNILVIDAQGGGIGRQIVSAISSKLPDMTITAVGTNTVATSAMLKAGADTGATGENAVIVGARKADVIIGPIGIVVADSLLGEITPDMAKAVGQSDAKRILIPVNHCDNVVVGIRDTSIKGLVEEVLTELQNFSGQ